MSWLTQSIMHASGVARGAVGTTHELTEARQGKYHSTMGPYSDPVLTIRPGDRVAVETRDAFEGQIRSEQDLPSKKLRLPFVNPQNGPIMVGGGRGERRRSPCTSSPCSRAARTRAAPAA